MNKIYIITYTPEDITYQLVAYQSESQAKHDMELMENIFARLNSMTTIDMGSLSDEELVELTDKINDFDKTLNKEEFDLFQYINEYEIIDGIFELKELEIKYVN